MKTIKARPITVDAFAPYGSFASVVQPQGHNLGGFYNDQITLPVSGGKPLGISPLIQHKPERMVVAKAEFHDTTGEGMVMMDDDMILHVAPAGNRPTPELTEAFIVPKGTVVCLKTGVWHCGAFPMHLQEAHMLILLPERIYRTDCTVVEYDPADQLEIVM